MKTLPAGLQTYLDTYNTGSFADLFTLTLVDGTTIYRWTNNATSLVVSAQTYLAHGAGTAPLVKLGAITQNAHLEIDTCDVELNAKGFTIGGLALPLLAIRGYFDGARLKVERLIMPVPGDVTTYGVIANYFEGRVSNVEPVGPRVRMRVKSELETLALIQLPKMLIQPSCNNALFDTNCTLVRATYTDAGTVSAGTTTTVTTGTALITGRAADFYNLGVLTFTSGALSGQRRTVADFASPVITLGGQALSVAPAAADTFTISKGCDKSRAACIAFGNEAHFRGMPHVPSQESGS